MKFCSLPVPNKIYIYENYGGYSEMHHMSSFLLELKGTNIYSMLIKLVSLYLQRQLFPQFFLIFC